MVERVIKLKDAKPAGFLLKLACVWQPPTFTWNAVECGSPEKFMSVPSSAIFLPQKAAAGEPKFLAGMPLIPKTSLRKTLAV